MVHNLIFSIYFCSFSKLARTGACCLPAPVLVALDCGTIASAGV